MKNPYTFKNLLLVFTIFLNTLIFAQTTHTIVLTCNTSNITKENVNKVCNFGQEANVSNEEYTIDVNVGDIVVWRGIAVNSELNSSIELKQVNYEGGKNVFGQNTIKDRGGIITGEIVQGQPGDEEKYNLKFKVSVDGRSVNGMFMIDPRIRVKRIQ